MTVETDINLKLLPGYRLIEHIGSGGYGEVWRAEAPGGLTKAIKIVFGQHNEKRASNELRALERIRSVRHPFLLSLERIEIIDGRLLVVTELADGSLKDRFDACRQNGLSGIPRDELLGYLRDAADALDFMSQAHTLQHLDIKPENLLLLAGRVKVADFGLVKDVRQSEGSLIGGMTPLYASPELFRSGPSSNSDQYSLAIVYQEMLTGTLPFPGGNPAELTLQHLNDEPDLSPISIADRYVVSRALSKNPEHRYATCREFVDALWKSGSDAKQLGTASADTCSSRWQEKNSKACGREFIPTSLLDPDWPSSVAPEQLLIDLPPTANEVIDLPAVNIQELNATRVPTLVLGIGGTAIKVVSNLRRLVGDRFSGNGMVPGVEFLLLDTDPQALAGAIQRDAGGLNSSEALTLPLRRPQHYREHSQQLLQWLSRRWLYNIPRSMRTEGLRPLGRLALADHARQTFQRIRNAILQALQASASAESNDTAQSPLCSNAVRVFVVASISGGTGSGMAIDVGYAVRAILAQMQLNFFDIIGLMMHSTGGEPRHSELARVNAYSWLGEFNHFQRLETAYPGDASCGLPAHQAGVPPFDHTYLIYLGENLDGVEFQHATESVAEYLQMHLFTSAGAYFDAFRRDDRSQSDALTRNSMRSLRSFGIYRQSALPTELTHELERVVGRLVLERWRRPIPVAESSDAAASAHRAMNDQQARDPLAVSGAAQLLQRMQLDASGIAANARMLIELQLGGDATAFLVSWSAKQTSTREAGPIAQLQAIDRIFGASEAMGSESRKIFLLGQSVSSIVQPLEEKLRKEVRRWVCNQIDTCSGRVPAARKALEWIERHCNDTETELRQLRETVIRNQASIRERVHAFERDACATAGDFHEPDSERNLVYFQLRLDQLAISSAVHTVRMIQSDAKELADEITALERELAQIGQAIGRATSGERDGVAAPETAHTALAPMAAMLHTKLPDLADEVDARLQCEYISQHGGLLATVMRGGRPRAQLCSKLLELSRQAVQKATAELSASDEKPGESNTQFDLHAALTSATPRLLEYGGGRRIVAVLPNNVDRGQFVDQLGLPATTISGVDNSLTLCVEASGLSIEHIAVELVERRCDRIEFAERVHSRTDIGWTPLVRTGARSEPTPSRLVERRSTDAGEEMNKTLVM